MAGMVIGGLSPASQFYKQLLQIEDTEVINITEYKSGQVSSCVVIYDMCTQHVYSTRVLSTLCTRQYQRQHSLIFNINTF